MSDSDGEPSLSLDSVFTEPPRPPSPEPTFAVYEREKPSGLHTNELEQDQRWSTISIRLVGSHPLWGHHLWNASRAFASYLDAHPKLYRNRTVLELGAGGGLPGLVAAKNGARMVVLTDYPDASLLDNLTYNVEKNIPSAIKNRIHVKGYVWGQQIGPLLELLGSKHRSRGYDLIIMSDLIFNHSQHGALLQTCDQSLSRLTSSKIMPEDPAPDSLHDETGVTDSTNSHPPAPCLLAFYTHHLPHLAHRDMEFFDKARERGWQCEEILTLKFPPMFPEDPGDEEVRSTVHGWQLTRKEGKRDV